MRVESLISPQRALAFILFTSRASHTLNLTLLEQC
jgi:hypothetical protein